LPLSAAIVNGLAGRRDDTAPEECPATQTDLPERGLQMADGANGNPVAVVTGAGRGIGRGVAVLLSQRGYRVALLSRTLSELEETARQCGPQSAFTFSADVSSMGQVDLACDSIIQQFERVDALVHCAGVAPSATIEQLDPETWRQIIDTNLSPIYAFCRRFWPLWRVQRGGVVVNISSQAARDPFPGLGAYGAVKAAVNLLGLALSREGAEIGLRVHTVAPGATETAMLRQLFSEAQIPREKTLGAEEVAHVVVQCVCGELAFTSGEVIYVHR
jgi:NAD(P)-dependent dehydrogenase (short-subunit alcohol dehydrogenase family)